MRLRAIKVYIAVLIVAITFTVLGCSNAKHIEQLKQGFLDKGWTLVKETESTYEKDINVYEYISYDIDTTQIYYTKLTQDHTKQTVWFNLDSGDITYTETTTGSDSETVLEDYQGNYYEVGDVCRADQSFKVDDCYPQIVLVPREIVFTVIAYADLELKDIL